MKQFKTLVDDGIAPAPLPAIRPKRWDRQHHDEKITKLGGRSNVTDPEEEALAALD